MGEAAYKLDQTIWPISINASGQMPSSSDPDITIGTGDGIKFTNSSGFAVSIHFTTSGGVVFNSIVNLPAGQTSQIQYPQLTNITVNYTITNVVGGDVSTPYGIQVGVGPLRINVTGGQPQPKTISIPRYGSIQFNSDAAYLIVWNPTNIFNPNPNQIPQGLGPIMTETADQLSSATYTLTSTGLIHGGGTVKIGS